ncbi:DUF3460 family protein [Sulfuritalea sp.]|uniref:DUF3460 family protein n=1 Tax=Sulfuritalea sp. TaxID=2480090 RepID=UPI001AD38B23|nr:DUF3460 family protein [Sulfuritalea sp.]MBN8475483.1 DUF3460 family protein [Sulfuritalea sp.]
MALYESEHTKFMREWMEKHPEEKAEQQKGRALWWDKAPRSLNTMKETEAARVPNKAYYYDAN